MTDEFKVVDGQIISASMSNEEIVDAIIKVLEGNLERAVDIIDLLDEKVAENESAALGKDDPVGVEQEAYDIPSPRDWAEMRRNEEADAAKDDCLKD